eukprot:5461961-Prymnesium_polylepis.1
MGNVNGSSKAAEVKRTLERPSGLKWEMAGIEPPTEGKPLTNDKLAKELAARWRPSGLEWVYAGSLKPSEGKQHYNEKLEEALARKTTFTSVEWAEFGITDLRFGDFVMARGASGLNWEE